MDNKRRSFLSRGWFQIAVLVLGIALAVEFARTSSLNELVSYGLGWQIFAIFIIGAMYSSVLTAAPATVGLVRLAETGLPLWLIVVVGGIGAMLSDLILFGLIKVHFIDALTQKFKKNPHGIYVTLTKIKPFRFLVAMLGAIIIATPIPDEIGLAMMGLGDADWRLVAAIGFIFNMAGIMAVVSLAR